MAATDEWICRIPRALLHALAGSESLQARERVLFALVAEVYSQRNAEGTTTSQARLVRLTGLHRRTVRRVLGLLETDGALVAMAQGPRQAKYFRLAESAPSQDQKSANPMAQPERQANGAGLAPTRNEEGEKGTSSRRTALVELYEPDPGDPVALNQANRIRKRVEELAAAKALAR